MQKISFNKGYEQLTIKDEATAKAELMAGLGITSRSSFRMRRLGYVRPSEGEIITIERIFKKYNISEIWD